MLVSAFYSLGCCLFVMFIVCVCGFVWWILSLLLVCGFGCDCCVVLRWFVFCCC